MSDAVPRLRMFAGPNGSGKSTLKTVLNPELLGVYLNPDDIEREFKTKGFLEIEAYGVQATTGEIRAFFRESSLLRETGFAGLAEHLSVAGGRLLLSCDAVNSYVASATADFLRQRNRAQRGGHSVPEDKIVKRYHLSLSLLMEAVRHTNRAYIFDNSGEGKESTWIAEITEGKELEIRADQMPAWFKHAVWEKTVSAKPPS